jgi:3-dehydroquinate dehydratase / shikimate dehydrogenase
VTYLCVPIFVTGDLSKSRRDIATAVEAGAEMIELRIDGLEDAEFEPLLQNQSVPLIVTCRPAWEGGYSELPDDIRLPLLAVAAETNPANFVDVELKSVRANEHIVNSLLSEFSIEAHGGLIVSYHDFSGRPERLYNLLAEMGRLPADVNKIVWTARTVRDSLEALEMLANRQRPTIALCMGEAGIISRVLAKKFGGFLSFASLSDAEKTAPGQLTIADMKGLYRWDSITPKTRVYGVVANPVAHSMSPAIHNAAFGATDYDGVYLPLLVEPSYESFKAFMESFLHFGKLDLSGLSVTIPHKGNALKYLLEKGARVEELAARIGAVNTILIEGGKLSGSNTDYAAILQCIADAAGIGWDKLSDLRVAVIGAGGTGRAAVAGLANYGATVRVFNRTPRRAQSLAEEFNGHSGRVSAAATLEELNGCDVWINASSAGMYPDVDASPLGDFQPNWSGNTIVFDAVYNPARTKFLAQAEAAGAKTIGGVEMFVRQAAAQFEAWTGMTAPREAMREVVLNRLQAAATK